jgi:hypothetical protein
VNVLVIPEDFIKDQYILKPIIKAMFDCLGKPRAKVTVCQNPRLQGVSEALKWDRIEQIIDQYRMVDLFLLCVDRDGNTTRKSALETIEQKAAETLGGKRQFFAENAWQEIEVWLLAGHDLPTQWNWQTIRGDVNPKEEYFSPFAAQRDLLKLPGQGRKLLAEEAARRYNRIRQLCPEDVATLEKCIQEWIDAKLSN